MQGRDNSPDNDNPHNKKTRKKQGLTGPVDLLPHGADIVGEVVLVDALGIVHHGREAADCLLRVGATAMI